MSPSSRPAGKSGPDVAAMLDGLRAGSYSTDAARVRRASRDMSAVLSPGLARLFEDRVADAVVSPRTEDELLDVVAAAARYRVPLIPRGAGTCNFGQSVPLRGGVVLELEHLTGLVASEPGTWRAWTGTILFDVDEALRPTDLEMRLFPSSKKVGTVGGYVNGGHAGIGAVRHGVLADRGNITGLRVMSVEESPRIVEVRGADVDLVHFSFGTSGIVTQVEMPTTKAWPWRDVALSFPTLAHATDFALQVALADGIDVKNVHPVDSAVAAALTPLRLPAARAAALVMVAPHSREALLSLAGDDVEVVHDVRAGSGPRDIPFYEYTWGHSVFWLRKRYPQIATLIALLPETDPVATLTALLPRLPDPTYVAISVKRFAGRPALQLSLCVPGEVQLVAASVAASELGALVADTHRPVLSASSIYRFEERQRIFKNGIDPHGLLNPGKLSDIDASAADNSHSGGLTSSGFSARR